VATPKKRAARLSAVILFLDETGLSVIPLVGKTWAPVGQTPVLRHNGHWDKVSAIAAVTPTGKLYFQMRLGSYDSAGVIEFLKDLLRHIRRRILLIWDNGLIHRSRDMQAFLHEQRRRLEVHRLPPYAPEVNPVEPFNSQLKFHKLKNYCPDTTEQLLRTVRREVRRIQRDPKLVRSFFAQTPLGAVMQGRQKD